MCRSRACAICGAPYLKSGSAMTCGADACRLEYRRLANRQHAAVAEERDPGRATIRQQEYRARVRIDDPLLAAAQFEMAAERARARRAGLTAEEKLLRNAAARDYYARHSAEVRETYKAWLDAMPPDRREIYREKARLATLNLRRRKSLAAMMAEAKILLETMESADEPNRPA